MASSATAASTATPFRTNLPFPPEIRDRIYKLVLISDSTITISDSAEPSPDILITPNSNAPPGTINPSPELQCLSILLVSKQVCLEAFHIFYRYNTLYFRKVGILGRFLTNIGYARRIHITHVTFRWDKGGFDTKEAFHMLRRCPNLEAVEIRLDNLWCIDRGSLPALGEVRGLKRVEFLEGHDHYLKQVTESAWMYPEYSTRMDRLKTLMMRPRLAKYTLSDDEKMDPLKPLKERYQDSGVQIMSDSRPHRERRQRPTEGISKEATDLL